MMRSIHPVVLRLFVTMAAAFVFAWVISEGAYQLQRERRRQTPQEIELVIPAGTAQRLEAGETVPSLPEDMEFVQGDVLVVRNEDEVSHQLGPIWVPPGSSGRLNLDDPQQFSYQCSFQATQYMGLDVRPRTTTRVRFQGILAIALPSGALLWLYTLVISPVKGKGTEAST